MLKLEKMTTSNVEETTASIDNDDIPNTVRNARPIYQKQLSVHLILGSILFSLAALYSLDINVAHSLSFDKALNWTRPHSVYAEDIFDGRIHLKLNKVRKILIIGIHLFAMLIFGILGDAKLIRARAIIIGNNLQNLLKLFSISIYVRFFFVFDWIYIVYVNCEWTNVCMSC